MTEKKIGKLRLFGIVGDDFDDFTAGLVDDALLRMGDVDEIEVRLNSPGGLVHEGLAIFNILDAFEKPITMVVEGMAISAASLIAMAGDRIVMRNKSLMMIHQPWNVTRGNAEEHRRRAAGLDAQARALRDIYARRSGRSTDVVWGWMNAETWFEAEEAVAAGLATEVQGEAPAKALTGMSFAHLQLIDPPKRVRKIIGSAAADPGQAAPGAAGVVAETAMATKAKDAPGDDAGNPSTEPAVTNSPAQAAPATPAADPTVALDERRPSTARDERNRINEINRIAVALGLPEMARKLIDDEVSIDEARGRLVDERAARHERDNPSQINAVRVDLVADGRDKLRAGAVAWLVTKTGQGAMIERHTKERLDPGEFRGMTLMELARDCLERAGTSTRGMDRMSLARAAITQSTSDFPVILENTLHKMLLGAYNTTPDTWSRFCATGSVSDFRAHPRYRLGSFGALDLVGELAEFKSKAIPDAEKQTISAQTKGNIINISRQSIINDDMGAFSRLATMLGRAARLTIEIDVYALLTSSSGNGPTMGDGVALFNSAHGNIGTGAAISVASLDADRVLMASQTDPSGNEVLDLRPTVLVVPIGLGGTARVINEAQYDPDTANKLQRPNMVVGLFRDIVDTARLTGTTRYLFADPNVVPVIEVVFLDGMREPFLESREGWSVDGAEWKVRLDYGVGAIDWRGVVKNAGA